MNDFRRQWRDTREEALRAFAAVGESGWYIMGRELEEFEHALATTPHEFEFYQVMRLLEALHATRPRFGRSARPADDVIRLAQEPSVTHAPASAR